MSISLGVSVLNLVQAVTIDDIVCVINSGRHKEKSYDPYTNVSTLQSAWISKASERQRRGRAGRCQQVSQHASSPKIRHVHKQHMLPTTPFTSSDTSFVITMSWLLEPSRNLLRLA